MSIWGSLGSGLMSGGRVARKSALQSAPRNRIWTKSGAEGATFREQTGLGRPGAKNSAIGTSFCPNPSSEFRFPSIFPNDPPEGLRDAPRCPPIETMGGGVTVAFWTSERATRSTTFSEKRKKEVGRPDVGRTRVGGKGREGWGEVRAARARAGVVRRRQRDERSPASNTPYNARRSGAACSEATAALAQEGGVDIADALCPLRRPRAPTRAGPYRRGRGRPKKPPGSQPRHKRAGLFIAPRAAPPHAVLEPRADGRARGRRGTCAARTQPDDATTQRTGPTGRTPLDAPPPAAHGIAENRSSGRETENIAGRGQLRKQANERRTSPTSRRHNFPETSARGVLRLPSGPTGTPRALERGAPAGADCSTRKQHTTASEALSS